MRRRTRTNVFLLAMVVLLGVGRLRRAPARARARTRSADDDRSRAIRSLAVTCLGCTARRYEKDDGHWLMREPECAACDDNAVDAPRLDRARAGALSPSREPSSIRSSSASIRQLATLEVDGTLLKFGTTDAIRNDRYVEVGGTIALVPDRFSALLFATPESEVPRETPTLTDRPLSRLRERARVRASWQRPTKTALIRLRHLLPPRGRREKRSRCPNCPKSKPPAAASPRT